MIIVCYWIWGGGEFEKKYSAKTGGCNDNLKKVILGVKTETCAKTAHLSNPVYIHCPFKNKFFKNFKNFMKNFYSSFFIFQSHSIPRQISPHKPTKASGGEPKPQGENQSLRGRTEASGGEPKPQGENQSLRGRTKASGGELKALAPGISPQSHKTPP
jgi:hypothetical protein